MDEDWFLEMACDHRHGDPYDDERDFQEEEYNRASLEKEAEEELQHDRECVEKDCRICYMDDTKTIYNPHLDYPYEDDLLF